MLGTRQVETKCKHIFGNGWRACERWSLITLSMSTLAVGYSVVRLYNLPAIINAHFTKMLVFILHFFFFYYNKCQWHDDCASSPEVWRAAKIFSEGEDRYTLFWCWKLAISKVVLVVKTLLYISLQWKSNITDSNYCSTKYIALKYCFNRHHCKACSHTGYSSKVS